MENLNDFLNNLENIKRTLREIQPAKNIDEEIIKNIENLKLGTSQKDNIFINFLRPQIVMPVVITLLIFLSIISIKDKRQNFVDINFSIKVADAQTVSLIGDFNKWDMESCKLTRMTDGIWRTELKLGPGRYQYQFVINGKKYLPDPEAREYVDDGYGNKNSILDTLLYAKS